MTKKMLIDAAHPEEVRVAVLDQNKVEDFDFESAGRKPLRGNIYLARVTRVEPSLQAAFVEYGGNRQGFLAFSEIHPDYYQIPVSDRQLLQAAEAEVAELAAQLELVQRGDEHFDYEPDDDTSERSHDVDGEGARAVAEDEVEDERLRAGDNQNAAQYDDEDDALNTDEEDNDDSEGDDEEEEEEPVRKKRTKRSRKKSTKKTTKAAAEDKTSVDSDSSPAEEAAIDGSAPNVEDDPASALPATAAEPANEGQSDAGDTSGDEAESDEDAAGEAPAKSRKAKAKEREELFERYKEAKRKRTRLIRNYKIQEVIKRRQILLVQVVKEERGNKGAALTTYLSLAGRYCVLMPNTARGGGISRKIATATDRRRLRRVVDSLEVPQGMGLIIRTAGAKRTKTEIKRDYDYLLRLWETIRTLTLKSIAPCLIYEEASLIKRAIRDLYDKDISSIFVEGEAGYREAKDFMKMLMPSHAKNVQPYKERQPIFLKYNVESQLDGMYQPTVRLKSGGYIVIHQTEALVAIDVNSGRATRERNIEQTALRTNIEAAQEAARQFRLRDLAGLIVVDFIDMEESKNNRKVEKALKDALKSDRARIQVGRISSFGLLELSRQRRRSGIVDGTTHTCPTCSGAGVVRSHEIAALRILRAIEGEALTGKAGCITAHTSQEVGLYILNHHREWLQRIEQANGVEVAFVADPEKSGDVFDLEKSGVPKERSADAAIIRPDQKDIIEDDEGDDAETRGEEDREASEDDGERKSRRKRRRRRRRKDGDDDDQQRAKDDDEEQETHAETKDGDEEQPTKRRRRRGRRGGRRNRRTGADDAQTASSDGKTSDGQGEQPSTDGDAPDQTPRTAEASEPPDGEDANKDEPSQVANEDAETADPTPADAPVTVNGQSEDAKKAVDEKARDNMGEDGGDDTRGDQAAAQEDQDLQDAATPKADKKKARTGWWRRGEA